MHMLGEVRVECKIPVLSGRKMYHLVNFSNNGRVLFKFWCVGRKNCILCKKKIHEIKESCGK